MPSENNPELHYELFEDKKAIKFMDSHSDDEKLIKRIYGKYHQLSIDPYNEEQKVHLKVENVQNVKKQEWGTIGLYISSMNQLKKLK